MGVAELSKAHGVRESMQWFTREKQWITDQQLQLCRIASPTFLEQSRAEWMQQQFRALGCEAHIDRAGNVVASPTSLADGPFIAVSAHLDTVLSPRHKDDISIDPDGTLHGPGVSDNGAGLAALLALTRAVRTQGLPEERRANVLFVANVGEEGEGNLAGMRYLCQQSPLAARIESYLVVDGPTTDHIITQALGSRRFDLTFSGPGGHSWNDYGIANPVHALARAIHFFTDVPLNGTPRSSINVGVIEGGPSVTAIPGEAHAKIDIRSESARRIDELSALLHEMVERAQQIENSRSPGGKVTARLREIGYRPAARLPEDAAILRAVRAADTHLGIRALLKCSSTDANLPLSLNLPALSIGAGGTGGGAHTVQEWFCPDGRDLGLKRIFLTLCLLMVA